jgi:glutaminyl-tRNA synthetase
MLIRKGLAYVDDQSAEEISATRGTPTRPGTESPYRNRPVEENLELFERMKKGAFPDGSKVLRAKIDMTSPNMHLRDPAMYRIKKAEHHRTGDEWCIYPMYDFAHGQSDYIEGVTHSICTLEFEVHRPLYDWFLDHIAEGDYRPRQYEFARLNLSYTVMSKRKLLELVESGIVSGWDDPRMPTLSGLRRRGYTPASIRNFSDKVGVAKRENLIDVSLLEHSVREDLNKVALRRMAVLDPVKLIITNYPEGEEMMSAVNNPEDPEAGRREMPFSRELYIERNDFMEEPPRKFFRLGPGRKVRLKYGYIIECTDYKKDPGTGRITEIYCNYFPESRSGQDTSGIKVKGTIHWVSAAHAVRAEVRLYDRLFTVEDPAGNKEKDFKEFINPDSLKTIENCYVEPALKQAGQLEHFQFERLGYFCADPDSTEEKPVFNRTVALRDNWAKIAGRK